MTHHDLLVVGAVILGVAVVAWGVWMSDRGHDPGSSPRLSKSDTLARRMTQGLAAEHDVRVVYVFFTRRPHVDADAWPSVYTDHARALNAPHRCSDVACVPLLVRKP